MRNAITIDANLNTTGKFGSGVEFDSIDPEMARVSIPDGNEVQIAGNAWTAARTSPTTLNGVLS